MDRLYKIQIGKQRVGNRDRLIYPEALGHEFISLAYNQDCSEAVIRADVPETRHDALKTNTRVTPLTQTEADELVKEYQSAPGQPLLAATDDITSDQLAADRQISGQALFQPGGICVPEEWQVPELQSAWVNYNNGYNPAGFMKDRLGTVHLRGLVKDGKIGPQGLIFELPMDCRPEFRQLHIAATHPNAAGRVDILSDGSVLAISGDSRWLSLDGIQFRAW